MPTTQAGSEQLDVPCGPQFVPGLSLPAATSYAPAMGGDVKANVSSAPVAAGGRTSGVRFQSCECATGGLIRESEAIDEGIDRFAVRSLVRVVRIVRYPFDLEAVLFSRKSGNHPAIWASMGHGFVRFSGGA